MVNIKCVDSFVVTSKLQKKSILFRNHFLKNPNMTFFRKYADSLFF